MVTLLTSFGQFMPYVFVYLSVGLLWNFVFRYFTGGSL